jgi:hypothetical protein
MGIAFTLTGLVLIVTGAQNTYPQLGTQLQKDFTGQSNFTYWVVSIAAVGVLGYIPSLRTFSTWFMALILLALFLSKGQGFFSQFSAALASGPVAPSGNAASTPASPGSTSASLGNTNTPGSKATNFSNALTNMLGLPSWLPLN